MSKLNPEVKQMLNISYIRSKLGKKKCAVYQLSKEDVLILNMSVKAINDIIDSTR